MPTTRVWDKHEIKAEIGRRGQTLAGVGELFGLNPALVRLTLANRNRPIAPADQAISAFLNVPLHELWPERYDDKGHRLVKLKPLATPRSTRRKKQ